MLLLMAVFLHLFPPLHIIICCAEARHFLEDAFCRRKCSHFTQLYVGRLTNRFIFWLSHSHTHTHSVKRLSLGAAYLSLDSFRFFFSSFSCQRQQIKLTMKYESHYVHRWMHCSCFQCSVVIIAAVVVSVFIFHFHAEYRSFFWPLTHNL